MSTEVTEEDNIHIPTVKEKEEIESVSDLLPSVSDLLPSIKEEVTPVQQTKVVEVKESEALPPETIDDIIERETRIPESEVKKEIIPVQDIEVNEETIPVIDEHTPTVRDDVRDDIEEDNKAIIGEDTADISISYDDELEFEEEDRIAAAKQGDIFKVVNDVIDLSDIPLDNFKKAGIKSITINQDTKYTEKKAKSL